MRTSDVSTALTLGRDAKALRPNPRDSPRRRDAAITINSLDRSLAMRPKAVCESAMPGSKP
eukprot:2425588-Prymnesium_polylepis.1